MREAVDAYSGLIVAAAGNDGADNDDPAAAYYPASFDAENIISVAASGPDDELYEYSNYGAATVDLAAPGSEILSTVDYWLWDYDAGWYTEYGYEALSGTSTAVPHVAGTAALLKALAPELSAAQIKAAILNTTDHSAALEGALLTEGRLNTYAALNSIGQPTNQFNFTAYLNSAQTTANVGETIYVDLMLEGDINYNQIMAKIAYDPDLLEYAGYTYLHGWVAAVNPTAPNLVTVQSVPTSNMLTGEACSPAVKIATLKFIVKDSFAGASADTELSFSTLFVAPTANVTGTTTAPAEPLPLTLQK
jgi:hypothetical protein